MELVVQIHAAAAAILPVVQVHARPWILPPTPAEEAGRTRSHAPAVAAEKGEDRFG